MNIKEVSGKKGLLLKFFETGLWNSITRQLVDTLQGSGAELEWMDLGGFRTPKTSISGFPCVRRIDAPKAKAEEIDEGELEAIIRSEMHTIFLSQQPKGLLANFVRKLYFRRLRLFAAIFRETLSSSSYDFVIIPNGRAAPTRLAAKICDEMGVETYFLETNTGFGERNGRYFFESFSVHDRIQRQENMSLRPENRKQNRDALWEWLEGRWTNFQHFCEKSGSDQSPVAVGDSGFESREINLFLTSSTDEHWDAGPQWNLDEWDSQYEAFDKIMERLSRIGELNLILRIHPNMKTKSLKQVREELRSIRELKQKHPGLQLVGPLDTLNTYDLISSSKRVFVALSTAGFEASALGVPVWCCKPTSYDLLCDVKSLWGPEDVTEDNLLTYAVDTGNAYDFFAATREDGWEFSPSTPRGKTLMFSSVMNLDLPLRLAIVLQRKASNLAARIFLQTIRTRDI